MSSRGEQFKKLCREAGRQLSVKAHSELAKHVATLRLMREQLQVKLLNGAHVDPADILKLDEALKRYLPAHEPIKVEIEICRSLHQPCRRCGASEPFACKSCGYHETVEADAGKLPPLPNETPATPRAPNIVSIHSHPNAPVKSTTMSPFMGGFTPPRA